MPADYTHFRRELQRIRDRSIDSELADLVDRLIADLERDQHANKRRFERFAENLQALDTRLLTIENGRFFRMLQAAGAFLRVVKRRSPLRRREGSARDDGNYQAWVVREAAQQPTTAEVSETACQFAYKPTISILMHVDRPRREWLDRAISSVRRQSYTEWELCICDDASGEDWLDEFLRKQSEADPRIRFVKSEERMGAASSLNRAGILSNGQYLAVFDQHDTLSQHALFYLTAALQEERFGMLYADEDRLDERDIRHDPILKPGWSPDLLTSSMYLGDFLAVSREAMDHVEWLRTGIDGAHIYDLALRLAESNVSVKHLPKVLVHSRSARDAAGPAKRALEDAVTRRGWQASVTEGQIPGAFQVRRRISGTPLASLVICSKTPKLLASCLKAIENRTAY